jgi:1-acyl-sn-glycerol-3-phosphate acyltransferase
MNRIAPHFGHHFTTPVPHFGTGVVRFVRHDPRRTEQFHPALPDPDTIRRTRNLSHLLSRLAGFKIELSGADLQKIRDLQAQGYHLLFTANHVSAADMLVGQEFGRLIGIPLVSMAAHENFDMQVGLWLKDFPLLKLSLGPLFQKNGLFSVNRGAQDKSAATEEALRLLKDGRYGLIVMPEAVAAYTNLQLQPFKTGTARIAGYAAEQGCKTAIVPMALYYDYNQDLTPGLEKSLTELETTLGEQMRQRRLTPSFNSGRQLSISHRIERLFAAMVQERLARYAIRPPDGNAYDQLNFLRQALLSTLEQKYWGDIKTGPPAWRARTLGEMLRARGRKSLDLKPGLKPDIKTLDDLINLDSYRSDYPLDNQASMREILSRLQREITGSTPGLLPLLRHSTAHIKIGEPVDVGAFQQETGLSAETGARSLTDLLETRIQSALQTLSGQSVRRSK